MWRVWRGVVVGVSLALSALASADDFAEVSRQSWLEQMITYEAEKRDINPVILLSIFIHESGDPSKGFALNPYALNVRGKGYYPSTREESYRMIVKALIAGDDTVGVGLGQVEWRYHSKKFRSLWAALDERRNVEVAADYFVQMRNQCGGDRCATAAYHNQNAEIGGRYLQLVEKRCRMRFSAQECAAFGGDAVHTLVASR